MNPTTAINDIKKSIQKVIPFIPIDSAKKLDTIDWMLDMIITDLSNKSNIPDNVNYDILCKNLDSTLLEEFKSTKIFKTNYMHAAGIYQDQLFLEQLCNTYIIYHLK